ncbi:MAG: hypothetical protein ACHQRM_03780 [Bacteroidia bacterium]
MKENETKDAVETAVHKSPRVTGMFSTRESAEKAYQVLEAKGYGKEHVHVIMSDETHKKLFSAYKHSANFDTHSLKPAPSLETKAKEGAETGAAVGIGLGAMVGAIAAMGTSILIPGLGILIAGSFLAGLAGASAGGLTGGLVGAFIGAGIPEEHAKAYEHGIKSGHIVLGVKPMNEQDAIYIEHEWKKHKGTEIHKA